MIQHQINRGLHQKNSLWLVESGYEIETMMMRSLSLGVWAHLQFPVMPTLTWHPLTDTVSSIVYGICLLSSLNEIKINPRKVSGTDYGTQIHPSHFPQDLHCSDTSRLVLRVDSQANTILGEPGTSSPLLYYSGLNVIFFCYPLLTVAVLGYIYLHLLCTREGRTVTGIHLHIWSSAHSYCIYSDDTFIRGRGHLSSPTSRFQSSLTVL